MQRTRPAPVQLLSLEPTLLIDNLVAGLPGIVERTASPSYPVLVVVVLPEVRVSGHAESGVHFRSLTLAVGPADEALEIEALDRGADIYLPNAESPEITEARLRAFLKNRWSASGLAWDTRSIPTKRATADRGVDADALRSLYSDYRREGRVHGLGRWLGLMSRRVLRLVRRQPDYLSRLRARVRDET